MRETAPSHEDKERRPRPLLPLCVVAIALLMACAQPATRGSSTAHYLHATSNDYNYFFLDAIRLYNNEDYAAACDLLQHCVALDSLAPEAYYLLAEYYAVIDADSLVESSLQRAIALNPKNDAYHERLAQWYLQTWEYDKAIAAYEYLYDNNKSRSDVLDILSNLYRVQKKYLLAIDALTRYEQIEGLSEETTLTKMYLYREMGEKKKEQQALQALCDEYPNDINVKVMMGNWLQQNGQSDEARRILLAAEETDPTNENVATSLYDFYRQCGEDSLATLYRDRLLLNKHTATTTKMTMLENIVRSAGQQELSDSTAIIALCDDILRVDSTNADIAEFKARYMIVNDWPQESVDSACAAVLAIAPDRSSIRWQMLQQAWANFDLDAIIAVCQPAVIFDPQEAVYSYSLGMAHFLQSDTLSALAALRQGVALADSRSRKETVADMYVLIGDIEYGRGDKAQAYAAYDSCLIWSPTNAACLNNYAYYLAVDNEELKRAESMSVKAVNLEPNNPTYLDTYAWVLYMQERYSEAKVIIDRTMENLDTLSDNSVLYDHAGDIYAACDDPVAAVAYWQQALLGTPDDAALIRRKIEKYEK